MFCFQLYSNAQNNYYYADNGKNYWQEDTTSINIVVSDIRNLNNIVYNIQSFFHDNTDTVSYVPDDDNIIIISDKLKKLTLSQLIANICQNPADIAFITYAKRINQKRIWLRNEIYVQLKNESFFSSYLQPFLSNFTDWVLQYDSVENDYKITCADETQLLQIANGLYDTSYVVYSTPDFYAEACSRTTDPKYQEQWALNNTGQQNGVPSVDIKAEKAWTFLQYYYNKIGDSIRVAVIDNGVENHEDLRDASGQSRVLAGYPTYGHGAPYDTKQWHGQACTGIIAASHNNKGGAGIAPNTLIVPIRIMRETNIFSSNARIRNGIRKSWQKYHAQILSNSWGTDRIHHSLINKAFDDAIEYGREGNGCIVVVASGNLNYSQVEYPANLSNVIAVGATDRCGIRAGTQTITNSCNEWSQGASSFGSRLSVVAPGSQVFTIDRMGILGADTGNYISAFRGTSAACPHVAGVAALILSVNPELTHSQVKEILEKTAQKVGGYNYSNMNGHPNGTFCDTMGYGMVNAFLAVAEAKIYGTEYSISGPSTLQLCNEYTYTLSGNVPEGYEIIWETNPHMAIVSGQGTSTVVIRPIYQATGNWVKVRICFDGETIREKQLNPILSTGIGHQLVVLQDLSITQNSLWDVERSLAHTVTIETGAVLTITTTIHCTDHARLIVNPGGKLIVDGGTLTSACAGEMWQGIEVVGNRTQHQNAAHQGTVILRNGAVIEHAVCGILTGLREDNMDFLTTGGIIYAENSTFQNCARAVEFRSYSDQTVSGGIANNKSHFDNCIFTVSANNHFANQNVPTGTMVRLWDVKGVSFNGCAFSNSTTGLMNSTCAIRAEDAGFSVGTLCSATPSQLPDCQCPLANATYSSFTGFSTAVDATTTGDYPVATVDEASFTNNGTAVSFQGNFNISVTRNTFDLSTFPPSHVSSTGLRLNGCTGYLVEQNNFHSSTLHNIYNNYGIWVSGSGHSHNLLYRNTFSKLTKGIRVSGTNGGNRSGLECTCNIFSDDNYDIYVTANATVSVDQGSASSGADNSFDDTQTSSFYHAGTQSLNYYHSPNSQYSPESPSSNVTVNGNASVNTCTSTLCNNGNTPKSPGSFLFSVKHSCDSLRQVFNTLDYASLLQNANANPNSAETAQNMLLTIIGYEKLLTTASQNAIRNLWKDTVADLQAIASWLSIAPDLNSRYAEAELTFLQGLDNTMLLQNISTQHVVTEDERDEYENYLEFNALKTQLATLSDGHVNWPAATPAQVAELQRIAEANTGRSSVMARGVLCFFFDICYEEEEGEMKGLLLETFHGTSLQGGTTGGLLVYPNPTDGMLYVALANAEEAIRHIAISSLTGKVLATQKDFSEQMDVSSIPAGLYILTVTTSLGNTYNAKFVKTEQK